MTPYENVASTVLVVTGVSCNCETKQSFRMHGSSLTRSIPLPPQETASLECLLRRLHPIHDLLLKRKFSDAAASRAVEAALKVGRKALDSGKAARMSGEHRAGWLWKVALNAARKAAARELRFVPLQGADVDRRTELGDDVVVFNSLRRAVPKLPPKQQQAFELHFLSGHSFRAAARLLGVAPGTVVYRYRRAVAGLAAEMTDVLRSIARNCPSRV